MSPLISFCLLPYSLFNPFPRFSPGPPERVHILIARPVCRKVCIGRPESSLTANYRRSAVSLRVVPSDRYCSTWPPITVSLFGLPPAANVPTLGSRQVGFLLVKSEYCFFLSKKKFMTRNQFHGLNFLLFSAAGSPFTTGLSRLKIAATFSGSSDSPKSLGFRVFLKTL